MTKERFLEIEQAVRENMASEVMLGELISAYEAQDTIIETLREHIKELQKP